MGVKMKKKLKLLFGVLVTGVVIAGVSTAIYLNNQQRPTEEPTNLNPESPPLIPPEKFTNNRELPTLFNPLVVEYNPITKDYRPKYNLTEQQFKDIFGELPKFPKDLFETRNLFFNGILKDISRLNESYWKQPEFYAGWTDKLLYKFYVNYSAMKWTPYGVGCFPEVVNYEVLPGSEFTTTTIIHTDFGIDSYQGMILYYYFPRYAKNMRGEKVFEQNVENAKKYIHVEILQPDNDPTFEVIKQRLEKEGKYVGINENERFILFPPTRYIMGNGTVKGFPSDWAKKLVVKIKVDKNCPKDFYVVAFDFRPPSMAVNTEFYWIYKMRYVWQYPLIIKKAFPFFQIIICVK